MRYTRRFISFFILTILVGLGFLMLSTDQVRALIGPCDITIEKEADPADDTEFDFSVTDDLNFDFILMDPNDATETFNIGFNFIVAVKEEVPPGWILDKIECTRVSLDCGGPCLLIDIDPNSLTIVCKNESGVETVTCTFFNVRIERNIPTLSEWGLIALAGILGIVGFMVMRRRKVAA